MHFFKDTTKPLVLITILFQESKGVYSLSIEDVQESDCGSYTFEVADEEGIESVNASIIMKGMTYECM